MINLNKNVIYISISAVLLLFLFSVKSILSPFLISFALAYAVRPIYKKISNTIGGKNAIASFLTVTFMFFTIAALSMMFLPMIVKEFLQLTQSIPSYLENIKNLFTDYIYQHDIDHSEIGNIAVRNIADKLSLIIEQFISFIISNLRQSGQVIANFLSLLAICPLIMFYLLRDWDTMMQKITLVIPQQYRDSVVRQLEKVDNVLSAYIRGQMEVCAILGIFYSIVLSIAKLDHAIFIGIATGVLSFIPYVGAIFGFCISVIVAAFQFQDLFPILIVILVFLSGQVLEGVFLSPYFIGGHTKLHPIFILFAIFVGNEILGLSGIVISIPAAAVIRIMIKDYFSHANRTTNTI